MLDSRRLPGGDLLYFHAGTNELTQPVVWQGNTYQPFPIESEGFDISTKGSLPRPKIRVANVNGMFSAEIRKNDDLVGCKIIRKRTFGRYLDDANFLKTNRLANSMDPATWDTYVTGVGVVEVTRVNDPRYGQVTRITKLVGATGDRAGIKKNVLGLTGTQTNASIWCKKNSANATGNAFRVETATLPSGVTTNYLPLPDTSTQWTHIASESVFTSLSGDGTFYVFLDGPVGTSIDIYAPHLSLGEELKEYEPTTGKANQSADPNQHFADDVWYIERKLNENRYVVEWELSSAFDLQGVMLPSRQIIQNSCTWQYRSTECGYTGAYFDKDNNLNDSAHDFCSKTLKACEVRFGNGTLPYGGFPGATRLG